MREKTRMTKQTKNQFHILSLGAGVQSTMLYLLAVEKHPLMEKVTHAIFADTGEEPESVYSHLEWLMSLDGPEILVRSVGHRLGDNLLIGENSTGQRFASVPFFTAAREGVKDGITRRQCTSEYKIAVVEKCIRREIVGLKYRQHMPKNVTVHQYMGLSFDEPKRVLKTCLRFDNIKWAIPHFPLFETNTTRKICAEWLKSRVTHEVPRSACVFCPYHSDAEWLRVKENPRDWARAVEIDHGIRKDGVVVNLNMDMSLYAHSSCLPLDQVEFKTEGNDGQMEFCFSEFGCDTGMCGT